MLDPEGRVEVFVDTARTADDLVRGCARDRIHRKQERLACAGIGEIDGDDDGQMGTTPMGEQTECKSESVDVRKTASP